MANEQNLKPRTTLSKEEAKELGRKGGLASAKARREKKTLKMELETLLSVVDEGGHSIQERMSAAIIKKAVKGDVRAFETIRDTIGQKPKENMNVNFEKNEEEAVELLNNIKNMVGNNDNET